MMRMKSRRTLFLAVAIVFALVLYYNSSNKGISRADADWELDFRPDRPEPPPSKIDDVVVKPKLPPSVSLKNKPPKITFILIWVSKTLTVPNYVPYFFQSVEANRDVDMLFIHVDRNGLGCQTFTNVANVNVSVFFPLHASRADPETA